MTFCDFQTTTYGKWILAGEHAVIRGHEALVFPIKAKTLILSYKFHAAPLTVEYSGSSGFQMQALFWSVLEHGMSLLSGSLNQISGSFHLDSNIPIGVGLGSSASVCVAVSRWFSAQNLLQEHQCAEFAKELEHLFHGKSSGLDIAGASAAGGICFKAGEIVVLKQTIKPQWFLSSCNQTGRTSLCIQQVNALWDKDPITALQIDKQMTQAVQESKWALEEGGEDAIKILASSINKASDCFLQWGLISTPLKQHMNQLVAHGAIAVKPTGSGGGGFVLSLWNSTPPKNLELIVL